MKAFHLWLPAYLRRPLPPPHPGVTHLLIAVCDHFEPLHHTDQAGALRRLAHWRREFPRLVEGLRDFDGAPPKHTFFYPIEQYHPDLLAPVAELCAETGSEIEIHLHHGDDTAESLAEKLERGKADLLRHGALSRDAEGRVRYGFIHGDWAIANSHPHGRHCGVADELAVLRATGCYADFTMPSMPSPTQSRRVNELYYAPSTAAPRAHDRGHPVTVLPQPMASAPRPHAGEMLFIQGPLGFNWHWRKWGVIPRIENGDLTGHNPPTPSRLEVWKRLGIHVAGRPDWRFIKLHTHGAVPQNYSALLGEPMRRFHEQLLATHGDASDYRIHYVTAREMTNILHAAEEGLTGNPGDYRNHRYRREGTKP